MDVLARNNVTVAGRSHGVPLMFAHGFGCDQQMWRLVAPQFTAGHQVILFDHVGAGGSDLAAYDYEKYSSLQGYADDVIAILDELAVGPAVFVGHSVSSVIGVLAAAERPELFRALVLIGPSPRYIDDDGYQGGFSEKDVEGLLESLDANYLGWSAEMAPVIMGNPDRPELGDELTASFCRTDPVIQRNFARTTFLSDNRADLARVSVPTLVVQCSEDLIAPDSVGHFVHQAIPGSTFVKLRAVGHCPNLSAPDETADAIRSFLDLLP